MTFASLSSPDVPATTVAKLDDVIAPATSVRPFQHDTACRPTFNAESTLARVEGNRELLGRMVGLFGMQWRSLWAEVAQAATVRDAATLQLKANKLKLSLASFGANEASRVAQELEELGSKSQFYHVEEKCARLKMEIEQLVAALKMFAKEDCD